MVRASGLPSTEVRYVRAPERKSRQLSPAA